MYDVVIIGGGPAGLSAALILGRCRRNVLICDSGKPRNLRARKINGYLTRDGLNPLEFLKMSKEELNPYGVKIENRNIVNVKSMDHKFEITDSNQKKLFAKRILIATGIADKVPDIPGLDEMYGTTVFHCPYCDGWESRNKKIAVLAKGKDAYMLAFSLKTWSSNVILFTNGRSFMRKADKEKLDEGGIKIYYNKIDHLDGENGYLEKIVFKSGEAVERDVLFFNTDQFQKSNLAEQLGCRFSKEGFIKTNQKQQTGVKGVFAAGDAAKDMKFVVVAAAEGARAGVAINTSLQDEEREKITENVGT